MKILNLIHKWTKMMSQAIKILYIYIFWTYEEWK